MKKTIYVLLTVFLLYIIIGNIAHYWIFPEELPDIHNYFKPGDRLVSEWEGIEQTVVRQEGNKLWIDLVAHPHSPGPPEHIHIGFEEIFEVASGTLSIMVDGEKHVLQAGEKISIPPGTAHMPFNETDSATSVSSENFYIPLDFAVYLSQVYGYFDASPSNEKMPSVLLQMSLFNQHFDSWLAKGPPIFVQKSLYFLVRPLARLAGYKSYYPEYHISEQKTEI